MTITPTIQPVSPPDLVSFHWTGNENTKLGALKCEKIIYFRKICRHPCKIFIKQAKAEKWLLASYRYKTWWRHTLSNHWLTYLSWLTLVVDGCPAETTILPLFWILAKAVVTFFSISLKRRTVVSVPQDIPLFVCIRSCNSAAFLQLTVVACSKIRYGNWNMEKRSEN